MTGVLLPLVLIVGAELALRLAGYGHPTSFFVSRQIGETKMLVENTWFGWRFFPPALARSPAPVVMPVRKAAGTYRIFLFGESAALGDPRPAYGMGRYLEVLLRERYPGVPFEVVCVAMTAINSHAILPIARECAHYDGDVWAFYMGNNEFAGPFGANTVFGPQAPPAAAVRFYLALERLRLGQLALDVIRHWRKPDSSPVAWGGLKMFLDKQLPPSDVRRARVYANFRENIVGIIKTGQRARIPVLLSSVASNLRDCAPFASVQSGATKDSPGQRVRQEGLAAIEQGRWSVALPLLQSAAQFDADSAEVHFALAEALAGTREWRAAHEQYVLARDLDALPFRADTRINGLAAELAQAKAGRGVSDVNAVRAVSEASPNGIPGADLFLDHVHLRPEGNYLVARAFAEEIERQLRPDLAERRRGDWLAAEVCHKRLGLTDWNRFSILEEMLQRLDEPPFTNQRDHSAQVRRLSSELRELKARMTPANAAAARSTYVDALRLRPSDPWLHHSYAEFLKGAGDLAGATTEMAQVRDLLPHHHAAYLQLGRLHLRQKHYQQARAALAQALRIRPDLGEAYVELAQIDAAEGRFESALIDCEQARRLRPEDAGVFLFKAHVLDQQNKTAEAIQSLQEAVRLRPGNWEARYQLALHFSVEHQFGRAEAELLEALRLQPGYAPAHFNLGFALARQDRFDEAMAQFRETLRLDPSHRQAREFLGTIERRNGN